MVVDVEVVVDVVEVELLEVVVDVGGGGAVSGVVSGVLVVSIVEFGGVVTDLAAVSSEELDADAKASAATPAAPITQKRLAISPFSPLPTRDQRHRSDPWVTASRH
jgi:hypothetical protein